MSEIVVTFSLSNNGKLKFSEHAIERIQAFKQDKPDATEAGGVILGRFILNSKDIVVDDISIPMIGDKRKRFSFIRNAKSHQRIIDNQWLKSKGTCNYLGEWHTHPELYPSYSETDVSNWKDRLKNDHFSSRYLYFVILGLNELAVWEGDRRTFKFKKLKKN